MERTEFNVPSISCSICAGKVKNGISEMNGINSVDVDLKTQMVKVEYDPADVQPKDIRKKVQELGYEVI